MKQDELARFFSSGCYALSIAHIFGKKKPLAFIENAIINGYVKPDGFVSDASRWTGCRCVKAGVNNVSSVINDNDWQNVAGVVGEYNGGSHFACIDKDHFVTTRGIGPQMLVYDPAQERDRSLTGFRIFVKEA